MAKELLNVQDLKTYFYTREGVVTAVDCVSFNVEQGEIFGLVGESGCGKSVSALSVMRLVPDPPGKIIGGRILFKGENLLTLPEHRMREIRGAEISMIFQDPTSSLNPIMKVGDQIKEAVVKHQGPDHAKDRVMEALKAVGIPNPQLRSEEYPFQFSGGMRQRIMIAMAISCNPSLLVADEPTTNLDVTIQAQILDLIRTISETRKTSVLLITHNLGLVAWLCRRVAVMYAGNIVERADTHTFFGNPLHPYTRALLACIPDVSCKSGELTVIKGRVPTLIDSPPGCRFYERCESRKQVCSREKPELVEVTPGHFVSCHLVRKH